MFPPLRRISPQFAGHIAAARNFLADRSGLILCALFLLVGLAAAGDYGIGPDEVNQRRIAEANLNYIWGQADSVAAGLALYSDRVYGVAFELPLLLTQQALGLTDNHDIHRLRLTLTHLFFILGAFCCYRLAWRLFDNRLIAVLALLLFLLHPRLYAHSFVNSKDLPFLSMFAITLYLLERAFRRDTLGAFVLLGIAVGLLTNLRIMGAMLFPAIIAMQGLDLFYAKTGPERKPILRTAGLFTLAAGLTLYALTPYAWTNPLDYLLTSLTQTANHPNVEFELFQGRLLASTEMPRHYGLTWFSITTPPPVLLLGFVGMAAVAGQGISRPNAVFPNNRRRFQLLLLACFALPLLAAVMLDSNQYNGWRQSYFLYAPFCLLAAGGLHWLLTAWARQGRGRFGAYGLTGLGVGLMALQLMQIHPGQQDYFNFLVDRTTPERLRTQYQLDYWGLAYREGLDYLRESHPGETLTVRGPRSQVAILPAADRQLLPPAAGRNADYELIHRPDSGPPDFAFNREYRRPLYNNTLLAVRPLHAARMTDSAIAAYREIYRQALAGEPIIRADYNVYLEDNRLTFVRDNCSPEEPDAWFGARLFPHYPETLPPQQWRRGSYVPFGSHGVRLGQLCMAVIQLPDYAAGDLILTRRTLGNFRPKGLPLWEELYRLSRPALGELIADHRRQRPQPANPAAFAVFIDQDAGRHRLIYAKRNCPQSAYETRVTLHIYPVNPADLPPQRRASGFDNRDFLLDDYGGRPGGECIAAVPLPDYPIASIRTGQAGVWEVNLYPPADPDTLRATYAALSDRQPDADSIFALYLQDSRLIYLRETCNAADTAAGFFLHIILADIADLPLERRPAGFANRDFAFDRWGGVFDGKCLAAVPLPEYPIKEIRTGQYVSGQGELWAAELAVGR